MPIEKAQAESKQMMLEVRFTEFPALSVDLRVGILALHRRPMFDYVSYLCHFFHVLCCITTFSERHSGFIMVVQSDVTSEIQHSGITVFKHRV